MDNYKLEDVRKLIENNLLSSDVLNNVFKSTTRRIENYDDKEAVKILNYLSNHEAIPKEIKEEINKYLAQYNSYQIDNIEDSEEKQNKNKIRIIILYALIIVFSLILLLIIIKNR